MSETEKRLHRCCFSGHRPEKINVTENEVKAWLEEKIDQAIANGYTTFITGMAMGVDIWAGQIVLQKKQNNHDIHLIAASPWPTFGSGWKEEWRTAYRELWEKADDRRIISMHYFEGVFQVRNKWMVDHSSRLIAYYNGSAGGTKNTIDYARKAGIVVVVSSEANTI